MDNLRQIEKPLSGVDQALGVISTPLKRITGVKNWAATGCRVPRAVGRVRQLALSTDGFFTIDVVLDEFAGALLTGTNKGVRIEIDPLRTPPGVSGPNPAWLAIVNQGGLLGLASELTSGRIVFSGDLLIDHSSFLEVHPTTPIEIAPGCDTFPPGAGPLYCSPVLDSLFSIEPGQTEVRMGRAQDRACFLTALTGALETPQMELAARIDEVTGDWVLSATNDTIPGPLNSTIDVFAAGQARCVTNNAVSDEFIWDGGPALALEPSSGTRDCFFTRVGGSWQTSDEVQVSSTSDPFILYGGSGQRVGARCIDVAVSTFPSVWGASPAPRISLNGIAEGCFFKQLRGPFGAFSGSMIDMIPIEEGGELVWTLGGAGATAGAAVSCAVLP